MSRFAPRFLRPLLAAAVIAALPALAAAKEKVANEGESLDFMALVPPLPSVPPTPTRSSAAPPPRRTRGDRTVAPT